MSLKLIPPGKRRNKTYYIFGRYEGQKIEVSTGTDDYTTAKEFLRTFLDHLRKRKNVKKVMSFEEAAQSYIDHHAPSDYDEKCIMRMCEFIGDKPIMDIVQDDIFRVVRTIFTKQSASTKNRHGITPASAILNYAAENQWRSPIKIKRYDPPEPKTRYATPEQEAALLEACKDDDHATLLLYWLFLQGDRIGDVVKVTYEDLDLEKQVFYRYISKTNQRDPIPLDPEICELLNKRDVRKGKIFTWETTSGPYLFLKRLSKRLGFTFTPHMGRHTIGKRLSDSGASLRVIMDKLGHRDAKSSMRYQKGDINSVREASKILSSVVKSVGCINKNQ